MTGFLMVINLYWMVYGLAIWVLFFITGLILSRVSKSNKIATLEATKVTGLKGSKLPESFNSLIKTNLKLVLILAVSSMIAISVFPDVESPVWIPIILVLDVITIKLAMGYYKIVKGLWKINLKHITVRYSFNWSFLVLVIATMLVQFLVFWYWVMEKVEITTPTW